MAAIVTVLRLAMILLALGVDRGPGGGSSPSDRDAGPSVEEPPAPARRGAPRRPRWAKALAAAIPGAATLGALAAAGVWLAKSRTSAAWTSAVPESAPGALALLSLSLWAVYLLWRVPQWQAAAWAEEAGSNPRERWEIENASRATLGQILSGVAVLAGLLFAWQQLGSTTRSVQISEQGQITDRFTSAVEQLASDELSLRLGGIYALERVAIDSPREFLPAMEVLSAFVREASLEQVGTPRSGGVAAPDISAAMKVIARRDPQQDGAEAGGGGRCLDLGGADLSGLILQPGANLRGLCLTGTRLTDAALPFADFSGSLLSGANLSGSMLDGASFADADLTGARLDGALAGGSRFDRAVLTEASLARISVDGATFTDARLLGADFAGAFLFGASFSGADFSDANLSGATLVGADLSGAVRLTPAQLAEAFVDPTTVLPGTPPPRT